MAVRRSEERGETPAGLTRAQTLDLCARLASYSEAGPTPPELLARAGREAVSRFGDDADVLIAVGRMYLMGEELGGAEAALRRAVRIAPRDAHALRLLGEVMLRQGDPAAAHDALQSAVTCGMNDPWTKTWVARALDYSELAGDLGRDGIARDVRQVLGKPGQGPPEDERRRVSPGASDPPARRYSRTQILGRIDKGVFFAGDPRAELPDFRRGAGVDEVVDLPTPAPPGTREAAYSSGRGGEPPPESAGSAAVLAALAEDAAWGSPTSEPMPPSDTEISAWAPEIEAAARARNLMSGPGAAAPGTRRSAPPPGLPRTFGGERAQGSEVPQRSGPRVRALRSTDPPPPAEGAPTAAARVAPPPPGLPRLSAAELYDEFTENRRLLKTLHTGSDRPAPEPPPRRGPPPLPPEPPTFRALSDDDSADDSADGTEVSDAPFGAGRSAPRGMGLDGAPSAPRRASRPGVGTPFITVLADDEPGPVTAPPSALIPMDVPSSRDPDAPPSLSRTAASSRDAGPVTAPASALLPPEPPSLQVPTRQLIGDPARATRALSNERAAARIAAAEEAAACREERSSAAPQPTAQPPAAKVAKPRSRLQTLLLRVAAGLALVAVLAGGYELYKRNRTTKIRTFAAQAAIALHGGGPRGVADAEAALAAARKLDPKSRPIAAGTLRAVFFAVLDVDPARLPDLTAAMDKANALGVRTSDMAFAQLLRAVTSNDAASAAELIAHHDEDPDRATDALYQLAAGVALEPQDAPAAIERYRAAVKLDGDLLSAEIRLTRALAFAGRADEAKERLSTASQKWPGHPELTALSALVTAAGANGGALPTLDASTDVDMLPRSLRAVARALSKSNDEIALAKAAAEADVAPIIVLCGEVALASGHDASARDAAQRAIDLSPTYAPAYALIAHVGLSAGRFEEARQAALRAPAEVTGEVLSFVAYEAGDLAAMIAAAGRRADDPPTTPVAAGLTRLRGAAPLGTATITALAKSPRFWADIVAMDAALDAGALDLAQSIATSWPGADKHPIRAARIARLLRYQGKNGLAQIAAASAVPSLGARIESALAAAEMASARDAAVASLSQGRTPEERWTLAFLLAREGREGPARAALRGVALPGADAPLLTRTVAALALGELRVKNPTHPMFLSLDAWTRNIDVARALGIPLPAFEPAPDPAAPPTSAPGAPSTASPSAAPAPTQPPVKAPLRGKLPVKDDGGDPY